MPCRWQTRSKGWPRHLEQDRAENLGRLFKDHGETLEGVRVANTEKWGDDPVAAFLRRAYRAAVNKDVDSIIVTKGAGDVPLFANTVGRETLEPFAVLTW